jgi:hypothetical protein
MQLRVRKRSYHLIILEGLYEMTREGVLGSVYVECKMEAHAIII